MAKIKLLLVMMGKRALLKYLPEILAWIFTRVFTYVLNNYPRKSAKVIETCDDLQSAISTTIAAVKDGEVTTSELTRIKSKWLEVFR